MLSSFRSNSFGISATIAFAFVMPNSRYFIKNLLNNGRVKFFEILGQVINEKTLFAIELRNVFHFTDF
ncbi:hypothetical protein LEP1GSC170_2918 [Leptospira interrogans serovar Bataviae str. HAI135]|nr:hypothetical protein LEP1GSC170_2918 [Leptospira interrogans serovar Bataviae str. HAI135]